MEAASVHVLGNSTGNRSIAVFRCPNYVVSLNDIDALRLDSICIIPSIFVLTLLPGKNYGIRKDRAGCYQCKKL